MRIEMRFGAYNITASVLATASLPACCRTVHEEAAHTHPPLGPSRMGIRFDPSLGIRLRWTQRRV